jgi:hypothetical protein
MVDEQVKYRIRLAARKRMGRSLTIRISDEMHEKLTKLTATLNDETPGRITTVSDVARAILEQGLSEKRRFGR